MAPLSKLSSKTHLVLYLKGRLDSDSGMLPTLDSLCQLIIDPEDIVRQRFSGTSSYILPNPKLAEFSFDPGISLESNWLALTKLPNFFASESPSDLGLNENPKLLQKLRGLDKITLRIPIDDIYNWWALSELRGPYQIALDFRATEEKYRFLLERITAGLSLIKSSDFASLALALRGDQIADLELLSKLGKLTQLTFDLRERKMVTIYSGSAGIARSSDFLPSKSNLEPLQKLHDLTQLTVYLYERNLDNLESLSKLGEQTKLALNLSHFDMSDLDALSKLKSLNQLTLCLDRNTQLRNWDSLSTLTRLPSLSIENATREQRMSLRKLPASLVELKF